MSDEFVKNICRTVGHEWERNLDLYQDICDRCKLTRQWNITNLAQAMHAPLKATLDYSGIGRKIIKVEEIKMDNLPIYDKDLPSQDSQA